MKIIKKTYFKYGLITTILLGIIFSTLNFFTPEKVWSPFGKVLTPKGDLRVLVIYAGFKGFDQAQNCGSWNDADDLPSWPQEALFYSSLDHLQKDTVVRPFNISTFFYKSSLSKFRLMADVLPKRIDVDPTNARSYNELNRKVMIRMKELYPDFNWKPYDSRTNAPGFRFDNSQTSPDHQPDYVIIAYRYTPGWAHQPASSILTWPMNFSRLEGLYGLEYNGYKFDGSGFTMGNFDGRPDSFKNLFLHEFAHELYSCPHYSGANGATGNYFHVPSMGCDLMNQTGGTTTSGFEKWLLGWTEITHDLKTFKDNGTYQLRDAETTGDVMRIKLPHTRDQYLWVENRQLISSLDHKPWRGQLKDQPPGTSGIPDKEPGVYMYIERELDDRSHISEGMVYDLDKVNGIYPLHAAGNFDYPTPVNKTHSPEEYWNNVLYWFERGRENAISGLNPYIQYRGDLDHNEQISNVAMTFGAFNGMRNTESFPIIKEVLNGKPVLTYANTGGRNAEALPYRRSDAFQKGDKAGLARNPVLVNRPFYQWNSGKMEPYYLNGLSITIKDFRNSVASVEVKFNDVVIDRDVRWTGNLILSIVAGSAQNLSVNLQKGKKITMDRTGIPNSHKPPLYQNTSLTIDSGAVFLCDALSILELRESSILKIKKGGTLDLRKKARLTLEKDCNLVIEEGGTLIMNAQAVVETSSKEMYEQLKKKNPNWNILLKTN